MKKLFFLLLSGAFWQACQDPKPKADTPYPVDIVIDPRVEPRPLFQVDSLLPRVDSAVVVFFDDPYGVDSLRYTRFYKQTVVADATAIQDFLRPLNVAVTASDVKRPCRIEGKIWCYAGQRLVQTLYWSAETGACRFQYLIRNGLFYYVHLTSNQQAQLNKWQAAATKPRADARD